MKWLANATWIGITFLFITYDIGAFITLDTSTVWYLDSNGDRLGFLFVIFPTIAFVSLSLADEEFTPKGMLVAIGIGLIAALLMAGIILFVTMEPTIFLWNTDMGATIRILVSTGFITGLVMGIMYHN